MSKRLQRQSLKKEEAANIPATSVINSRIWTRSSNPTPTMVLCEEGECSVCLLAYTRSERIPRLLHCRHTFCQPCLETMSQTQGNLLTVGCPLCRHITCISRGLGLQEALWVDSRLWEQISGEEEDELEVQHKEEVRMKGEDERKEKTESRRGVEWSV